MHATIPLSEVTKRGAILSKPPLKRIITVQLLVLLLAFVVLLSMVSVTAYSSLFGGLIAIGPNAYFSYCAFRFSGARVAGLVARSFYHGEMAKFLLTTGLFAGVFALVKPIDVVALLLTYVGMIVFHAILAQRFIKH